MKLGLGRFSFKIRSLFTRGGGWIGVVRHEEGVNGVLSRLSRISSA